MSLRIARESITLTDLQIAEAVAKHVSDFRRMITEGDADLVIDEILFTDGFIADYLEARKGWTVKGEIVTNAATCLQIADCQVSKGDKRRDLTIVDLGTCLAITHHAI